MKDIQLKQQLKNVKESISLDLLDRKILYELNLNGRATYAEIGKQVRLSKQAIKERIEQLEKADIIKQYFALIDIHRMGYTFYRLDLKLQNITESKEKEIMQFILKLQKVIWLAEIHGKWDIAVIFLTKDIIEIDNNIKNIRWKFYKYIQEQSFSICTSHTRYKYGFLLNKEKEGKEIFMGREFHEDKMSDIERKVLALLAKEGRISLTALAQRLHTSVSTVKYAMKKLFAKKILIGFDVLLDLQKIGYLHYKLFINFQNPSEEKEKKLEQYFRDHPNIIFMTKSLGRSDIECEIIVKSLQEFRSLLREMKHIFSDLIKDVESYIVMHEYLTNYYPV